MTIISNLITHSFAVEMSTMDPIYLLRGFFLFASSTIFLVNAIPAFRFRFLAYGARAAPVEENDQKEPENNEDRRNVIERLLDYAASLRVPHSYFLHYYIISVSSSIFWGYQIFTHGPVLEFIISRIPRDSPSMTIQQVLLAWTLMAIQGSRRLIESYTLVKPSKSTMWCVHWWLGWAFYLGMGMSVWIEGASTLRFSNVSLGDWQFSPPSLRSIVGVPLFLIASGIQHDCHVYLASLVKYTLPVHPAFQRIICPHYFAECLIYLALSIIAAPRGEVINKTVFSGLIFVVTNLGMTAGMSKEWYIKKFGEEKVKDRWNMIPFIY